jgi:glycosyltransferase involved in cell wall biosynthesis
LQGAGVIGSAARVLAGEPIEITMIGHGQDYAETSRSAGPDARVTWIRWVPSDELPKVVASHDVCLGIFGVGPKARSVVPNKVYQGMAAGLAIVTSDTEPQRRAIGDAAWLVPPGDAAALAEALKTLAADRDRLAALQRESVALAEATMTAEVVATPLVERLRILVGVGQVR